MTEYMRNIVLSALYEDKDSYVDTKDLSEEDELSFKIIQYIKECIESDSPVYIDLLDENVVYLNPNQAKDLIYIHDNLNAENQTKFRSSLIESKDLYEHFINFSKVKHQGG